MGAGDARAPVAVGAGPGMTRSGDSGPTFSILIATYNAAQTLQSCLDSLFAQEGADFEVLVADGASRDATGEILERHDDAIAWWTSRPDDGPYDAWNSMLPHARGEWVMFLGADDRLAAPDTLARLTRVCRALPDRSPRLDYVYGETEFVTGGAVIERFGQHPLKDARQPVEADFAFSHTGLLHHRDLFATFGGFSTRYSIAGDAHFMLRSLRDARTRFYRADMVVARMAAGGLSSGVASRVTCYREVEDARRELGITPVRPAWLRALQRRSALAFAIHRIAGEGALLGAANLYRRLTGRPPRRNYR